MTAKKSKYAAFISYSHEADEQLASALQTELSQFAKPWYRLRALHVFRDKTNLSVKPGLWGSIEEALSRSEYFILLASPESAASPWVRREIGYWLEHKIADTLLIVLAGGSIKWDDGVRDFDWNQTTALPHFLRNVFVQEPLFLDLSWVKNKNDLSPRNPDFQESVVRLAATLHGQPIDVIAGQDVRHHRTTIRLASAAAIGLTLLTLSSIFAAYVAVENQKAAERQSRISLARQLAAQAEILRTQQPKLLQQSISLAIESLRRFESAAGLMALQRGLALLPKPVQGGFLGTDIVAMAFSPDGRYFATAHVDGKISVREVDTGREVSVMSDETAIWDITFSPDGTQVATRVNNEFLEFLRAAVRGDVDRASVQSPDGYDTSVYVWDTLRGQIVRRLRHEDVVHAIAYSADGRYLATGSSDHSIRIWDPASGLELRRLMHDDFVYLLRFSKNGRYLASNSDNRVWVWETETGRQISRTKQVGAVSNIAISPDGKYVAASIFENILVWDIHSSRVVADLKHQDRVTSFTFSPTGSNLASGSNDRIARIWRLPSGEELQRMAHDDTITAVTYSPDGKYLATAGWDDTARVWTVDTGREIARIVHEDRVEDVEFSLDGRLLATRDMSGQVGLWETTGLKETARIEQGNLVRAIEFSPDGDQLAIGSDDGTVVVIAMADWREELRLTHDSGVTDSAYSRHGAYIATASSGLHIWDALTGQEVGSKAQENINRLAFSPDGRYVATASGGPLGAAKHNAVLLWDSTTLEQTRRIGHEHPVWAVAFSSDGLYFATASGELPLYSETSKDSTVQIWQSNTGRTVSVIRQTSTVWDVTFSPNNRYLATAAFDGSAKVWDAVTGRQILQVRQEDGLSSVAFTRSGEHLATTGADGTARIWRVADGRELARFPVEQAASAVAFSPDERYIAIGDVHGTTTVWQWKSSDLIAEACSRLTRNLTHDEWQLYLGAEPYKTSCSRLPIP